jgi:hypothetical protein
MLAKLIRAAARVEVEGGRRGVVAQAMDAGVHGASLLD